MVTLRNDTCDSCKRPNPISFTVTPKEAWKIVGSPGLIGRC